MIYRVIIILVFSVDSSCLMVVMATAHLLAHAICVVALSSLAAGTVAPGCVDSAPPVPPTVGVLADTFNYMTLPWTVFSNDVRMPSFKYSTRL